MDSLTFGEALACLAAPGLAALAAYAALRASGTLCVNAGGWHAGNLRLGRRVCLSALRLFGLFQPLMRLEAWLRGRRSALGRRKRGETVSDVVVELVPIG